MNSRKSLYDIKSFYNKGAVLSASFQGMRYRVEGLEEGEKKILRAVVWPEPFCFEKTQEEEKEYKSFDYSEEGLDQVYEWLCTSYEEKKEAWTEAMENPYGKLSL